MGKLLFLKTGLVVLLFSIVFQSCKKEEQILPINDIKPFALAFPTIDSVYGMVSYGFPEDFEMGKKTNYTTKSIWNRSGSWRFVNSIIDTLPGPNKDGQKGAKLGSYSNISMNFSVSGTINAISISHAKYVGSAPINWELHVSTNGGASWTKLGQTNTTTSDTLSTTVFSVARTGNIRFRIRKLTISGYLSIDNVIVYEQPQIVPSTKGFNMLLGNPSNATASTLNADNFLMAKKQYTLSYSRTMGIANWVSWHLSTAWMGDAERQNDFRSDATLPTTWFRAKPSNYSNTGFNKGHMCPSEDRTDDTINNSATFLMTNMIPQSPKNNQNTWRFLEGYCQKYAREENGEMYIICGTYSSGGDGSNGPAYSLANGNINVPSHVWKVIVFLPSGPDDINRIKPCTRVTAVFMPNSESVVVKPWYDYRVSVDFIESQTGLNILSNLSDDLENILESRIDTVSIN